jgi:P27 family predicted phage terminase small subunit
MFSEIAHPSFLRKDGIDEWNRLIPILNARGDFLPEHLGILTSYCIAWQDICEASEMLAKEGQVVQTQGGPKRHPAMIVRNQAMAQLAKFSVELRITPRSTDIRKRRPRAEKQSAPPGLEDAD